MAIILENISGEYFLFLSANIQLYLKNKNPQTKQRKT